MSSLPDAEDVRISAGPSGSRKSLCRRCLPCIGCLALVGLIVGLSVHFTGKNPATLASDAKETYEEYFGGKREDPTEEDRGSVALTSVEFKYGGPLPARYTSDGEDISPPLDWADLPEGTRSLVILCEDHDYPHPDRPASYPWVHWVAYDVNPELSGLPELIPRTPTLEEVVDPGVGETMSAGAAIVTKAKDEDGEDTERPGPMRQGSTSWENDSGYRGPDPPEGHPPHRYYFRVLALDDTVEDKIEGRNDIEYVTYDDILAVVEGDDAKVKVLGFGLLMGTYQHKK